MNNYERYMLDFFKEDNEVEYNKLNIYDEDELIESYLSEDSESLYKLNYFFRDKLQLAKVSSELSKQRVREGLIELTGNYIDSHSKALTAAGPIFQMTFGTGETRVLYELFNTSAEELVDLFNAMVKETYNGSISKIFTGLVNNAPHKILLLAILIDATQNGYEDVIECIKYLWAFSEYPVLYKDFWKTGVKEDVMNYTIEHLGNKFKIKKMNNLQELLFYDASKPIVAYTAKLKTGYDNVYMDLMYRLRTQFRATFRKIANEYYKNAENNATQHNNPTMFDDGQIADSEGIGANVAQIIDHTIHKFASMEINSVIVNAVAEGSQVDTGNIKNFLAQIYATKNNRLNTLIEDIITSYFKKNINASNLDPGEFMNYGLTLFRTIASSKDPIHQEIRAILNVWMFGIIDIRSMYERQATITNYTRAIFNYIIFMIARYN